MASFKSTLITYKEKTFDFVKSTTAFKGSVFTYLTNKFFSQKSSINNRSATITFLSTLYCIKVLDADTNSPVEGTIVEFTALGVTQSYLTNADGEVKVFYPDGVFNVRNRFYQDKENQVLQNASGTTCLLVLLNVNPCIIPEPENRLNFLRWHRLFYDLTFSDPIRCCETETPPIANPFISVKSKTFKPLYIQGELGFFHANIEGGITDSDFEEWRLVLFSIPSKQIIASNFGFLTKVDLGGGFFQFSSEFSMPQIPSGEYHFLIYNESTQKTKFISNPIIVDSLAAEVSTLISYTNDKDRDFFPYSTTEIVNKYRILLFEIPTDEPFQREATEYTATNTGKPRFSRNLVQHIKSFELHKADPLAHEAMFSALLHPLFNINNRRFVIADNGSYTLQNTSRLSPVSSARFSCYDYEFSRINS